MTSVCPDTSDSDDTDGDTGEPGRCSTDVCMTLTTTDAPVRITWQARASTGPVDTAPEIVEIPDE